MGKPRGVNGERSLLDIALGRGIGITAIISLVLTGVAFANHQDIFIVIAGGIMIVTWIIASVVLLID